MAVINHSWLNCQVLMLLARGANPNVYHDGFPPLVIAIHHNFGSIAAT